MAGLLDSDFMRFLTNNDSYWQRRDQAADAERFQGLLGSLEQQGPVKPGGLLEQRAPDQQFWMKAAQIPSYQGIAANQLSQMGAGQQAMERQQQAQGWEANNMTLAQTRQQELQEQRAQQQWMAEQYRLQLEQQRTQASVTNSYSSAAASDATRQFTNERLSGERFKNQQARDAAGGPLYNSLPPVERQKANVTMLNADGWAQAASDVEDWVDKRSKMTAMPLAGTAEADAINTEWQSSVKPAFMQILNTGVLQGNEAEELAKIIGQPSDKVLTESQRNVIKVAAQKVRDLRRNTYQSYGFDAPAQAVGGSAYGRTRENVYKPQGAFAPPTSRPGGAAPANYTPGVQGEASGIWDANPNKYAPRLR